MKLKPRVVLKHFEDDEGSYNLSSKVYSAMENDDLSEVVITVMNNMRLLNLIPDMAPEQKCKSKSYKSRFAGNESKAAGRYTQALICYNEALMYAPFESMEMKKAYDSRSSLLFVLGSYDACIKDIDICLNLNYSRDAFEKLTVRKNDALFMIRNQRNPEPAFSERFFSVEPPRSVHIPCGCADIGVLTESINGAVPKAVAINDIKIGTVVAVETAFVSHILPENTSFMCYHCQKVTPNLVPCLGCVRALFCSESCHTLSTEQYHKIECNLDLRAVENSDDFIVILKCVLKLRNLFCTWEELIDASRKMGAELIADIPTRLVYDENNPYAILCFHRKRHFIYGTMFNGSVACATILHYLTQLESFFPKDDVGKDAAMRAVARIMMHLYIYGSSTFINSTVEVTTKNSTTSTYKTNVGIFSFIGKLNHSCNPNLVAIPVHNKMALVAVQPIKKGTELTLCLVNHFREGGCIGIQTRLSLLQIYGVVCDCIICNGDWQNKRDCALTGSQRKMMDKLNLDDTLLELDPLKVQETYTRACRGLRLLNDIPFSKEYATVYACFDECLMHLHTEANSNRLI